MKNVLVVSAVLASALTIVATGQQASPTMRIVTPDQDTDVSGPTRLEVSFEPQAAVPTVRSVMFSVDGREACTIERKPFVCWYDPGDVVKTHHVRVVAMLNDDSKLIGQVHTHNPGFTESVRPTPCWCRSSSRMADNSSAA